jgi:hypothetical protein
MSEEDHHPLQKRWSLPKSALYGMGLEAVIIVASFTSGGMPAELANPAQVTGFVIARLAIVSLLFVAVAAIRNLLLKH